MWKDVAGGWRREMVSRARAESGRGGGTRRVEEDDGREGWVLMASEEAGRSTG